MQRVLVGVSVALVVGSQVMPAMQPAIWASAVLHGSGLIGTSPGLPIANQTAAPATVGRSVAVGRSLLVHSSLLLNTYVALGDSYSSGESVQPFLPGTGTTPQACDRSKWAYPRILSKYLPYHLDFVACSGATTADVLSKGRFPGQPAQIDSLNPAKDALVTLTVGGDNLGFATIITKCVSQSLNPVNQSCVRDPGFERSILNAIYGYYKHPSIRATLTVTFARIKAKARHARIIVLDYPNFFPTSISSLCFASTRLTSADGSFISKVVNILDQQESEAAQAAGVSFLDVRRAFRGHGLCSSDPYVNGITFRGYLNDVGSFHPNASGQLAYAAALRAYLAKPAIQKTNGPMWPVVQCPTTGGGLAHLTPPPPVTQLPAARGRGIPASGVAVYVASSLHSKGPWIFVYAPSNEPCAAVFDADGSGSITVGTADSATYTMQTFSTSMAASWNAFCGILPSSLTKRFNTGAPCDGVTPLDLERAHASYHLFVRSANPSLIIQAAAYVWLLQKPGTCLAMFGCESRTSELVVNMYLDPTLLPNIRVAIGQCKTSPAELRLCALPPFNMLEAPIKS